ENQLSAIPRRPPQPLQTLPAMLAQMAPKHFANSTHAAFALPVPTLVPPNCWSQGSSVLPLHGKHLAAHARPAERLKYLLLLTNADFRVKLDQIFIAGN